MAKVAGVFRSVLAAIAIAAVGSTAARGQASSAVSGTPRPGETRQAGPARGPPASERAPLPGHLPKRTVLHFEDDSIRGDLTRPDGELVQAPRRVVEGSLVRLRKSFIDRALAGAVRGE
jgi:hypothetical protein